MGFPLSQETHPAAARGRAPPPAQSDAGSVRSTAYRPRDHQRPRRISKVPSDHEMLG